MPNEPVMLRTVNVGCSITENWSHTQNEINIYWTGKKMHLKNKILKTDKN